MVRFVSFDTPHVISTHPRNSRFMPISTKRRPITSRMTKRTVVRATTAIDVEAQLRLEISSIGRAFASEDGKEARRAFLEKRAPVFKGE
jgi:enoyl-CoA hydratase/carnithine racemase